MTTTDLPARTGTGLRTVSSTDDSDELGDESRALAAALERAGRGRGPLRPRQPGGILDRRVELPAGSDRRGGAAALEDVVTTVRCAASMTYRSPPAAGDEAGRTVLQRGGDHRLLEVPGPRRARSTPPPQSAVVEPGCKLDDLRNRPSAHGLTFGPDPATHSRNTLGGMIGNNSCGIHSVMAEFYGPGPLTAPRARTRHPHLRRRRMTVGPSAEELDGISARAGARPRSTGHWATRDRDERSDPHQYPTSPAGSPATTSTAAARERLQRRPGAGRHRGDLRRVLRATVQLIDATGAHPGGRWATPTPTPPATTCRWWRAPPGRPGGNRPTTDRLHAEEGPAPRRRRPAPDGDGWLLVEFGGDTKDEADEQAEAYRRARGARRPPVDEVVHRRLGGAEAVAGPRVRTGRDRPRAGHAPRPTRAGRTPRSRRRTSATTCATSASCSTSSATRGAVRPLRAGLHPLPHRLRPQHRPRRASGAVPRPRRRPGRGLRRVALRRARRWPGARRAAREDVRRELVAAFARVQGRSGIRTADEPRQGRRTQPADRQPALGPRRPTRRHARPTSRSPTTTSTSATRSPLRGRRRVPRRSSGTMCPSYMATREEEDSTRGRSRLLFEMLRGDELDGWRDSTSRRRSTCASPARRARTNARSTSTWRPTRPSSCPTTTSGRLRPRADYAITTDLLVGPDRQPDAAPGQRLDPRPVPARHQERAASPRTDVPCSPTETFTDWFRAPRRHGGDRRGRDGEAKR